MTASTAIEAKERLQLERTVTVRQPKSVVLRFQLRTAFVKNRWSWLALLAGEAPEEITPAPAAADPRLLVRGAEALLRQSDGAARAWFSFGIRFVDFGERLRLFHLARAGVPVVLGAEQSFP